MYKTLWFTHSAYRRMLEIASQAADGLEIGGHLYGYTHPNTADIVVTHVYPMGPNGRRTPDWTIWDNDEVKRLRKECWGDARWEVGDFHTHPEAISRPSAGDISGQRNYRAECGWNDKFFPDALVVIGVPPGGTPQEVGAWFVHREGTAQLEIRVANPEWNPIDENGNWIEKTERGA